MLKFARFVFLLTLQTTAEQMVITFSLGVRPSVTKTKTRYNGNVKARENKIRVYMRENNDHLLAGAWWVILNSLDLFNFPFLNPATGSPI